jgi:hypothetical protein
VKNKEQKINEALANCNRADADYKKKQMDLSAAEKASQEVVNEKLTKYVPKLFDSSKITRIEFAQMDTRKDNTGSCIYIHRQDESGKIYKYRLYMGSLSNRNTMKMISNSELKLVSIAIQLAFSDMCKQYPILRLYNPDAYLDPAHKRIVSKVIANFINNRKNDRPPQVFVSSSDFEFHQFFTEECRKVSPINVYKFSGNSISKHEIVPLAPGHIAPGSPQPQNMISADTPLTARGGSDGASQGSLSMETQQTQSQRIRSTTNVSKSSKNERKRKRQRTNDVIDNNNKMTNLKRRKNGSLEL